MFKNRHSPHRQTVSRLMAGIINFLTTKQRKTKFSPANFQKMLSPSYVILRIQRLQGKQCRSRYEVAHHEPPHQDLHCLQIQLFSSLVLKELMFSLLPRSGGSVVVCMLDCQSWGLLFDLLLLWSF